MRGYIAYPFSYEDLIAHILHMETSSRSRGPNLSNMNAQYVIQWIIIILFHNHHKLSKAYEQYEISISQVNNHDKHSFNQKKIPTFNIILHALVFLVATTTVMKGWYQSRSPFTYSKHPTQYNYGNTNQLLIYNATMRSLNPQFFFSLSNSLPAVPALKLSYLSTPTS